MIFNTVVFRNVGKLFLVIFLFSFITAGIVFSRIPQIIGQKLGFVEDIISISGTGSMNPTFPKGKGKTPFERSRELVARVGMQVYPSGFLVFGKQFFEYSIQRGDIVDFTNGKVQSLTKKLYGEPSGFVKRIIAVEGDTIEIRDGLVYLNGKMLSEPYTALARSTFGGEFLSDCKKLTVPSGKIFVMGDNRKGSGDSRHEIGLISISDIEHVIPLPKQKDLLDKNWRDTSKDILQSSKIHLDKNRYLFLLNEKRKEVGVPPLRYEPRLEKSSENRARVILEYNDFSFEATRSGVTMKKAMNDAGYSNIVWGEMPDLGYYEADELIESYFESGDLKDFLLNKDYQDFSVSTVEGEMNGCPTQVVVQHFGGYVPPNYSLNLISGWKSALFQLKDMRPGWQAITEFGEFYEKNKQNADRINEIIAIRIFRIDAIVKKMETNQWLTDEETAWTIEDENLSKKQNDLAQKLNAAQ